MVNVNLQIFCTMYKKVLYSIKKIKKNWGVGRGNIWVGGRVGGVRVDVNR